jgi:glycosyltransferase involved in cell wall biosynthesis
VHALNDNNKSLRHQEIAPNSAKAVLPAREVTNRSVATRSPLANLRIAHVGTFPPRKCGIATYTQDTLNAIQKYAPAASSFVVAMTDPGEGVRYEFPVRYEIPEKEEAAYTRTAQLLNRSGTDLINIQYEHGIFGGENGIFLSQFLDSLNIPSVATLHTVLPDPSEGMIRAIRELADKTDHLIVLNSRAIPLLRRAYGVTTERISVIPHGTPNVVPARRPIVRKKLGIEAQTALTTFGLISPGKGLEFAIDAVARVAASHPTLHYYILGATHPNIIRQSGELYRDHLKKRAADAGIEGRVHFVDRYLSLSDLTDWLLATDVYVTPYLNANQIVSGTLAYAVAAGKSVISTPYLHAQELLSDGRGLLTPFRDADAMASNIAFLLDNPARKTDMERRAWAFGRTSQWSEVAQRYAEVFESILTAGRQYSAEDKVFKSRFTYAS